MEKVDGIGGFFFTAQDPAALGRWYAEHLGIAEVPTAYDAEVWTQSAGETVFAPFPADAGDETPVGPSGWGINFRVTDLEAMAAQLRGAGIEVEVDPTEYPNGWFAQLSDPEGNAIQLWQPT
ncbi:MAG TPA: VOC family protein [Acidimicrobiales bacterium]|nr:VOC family protein [Acidimicrobiales bacterium]